MDIVTRIQASQLPPPEVRLEIRRSAGASLRECATELDVTAMTVLRWERGETSPRSRAHAIAYRDLLDRLRAAAA